jgi:choline dehydrogenase-like flavoprotein
MLYVRGNRRDYDSWEQMGNYGWGYDHVLPYFTKSEDNRNPYLAESPYHGVGGYLTVQEAPYKTPLATAFVEGGVELGNKKPKQTKCQSKVAIRDQIISNLLSVLRHQKNFIKVKLRVNSINYYF